MASNPMQRKARNSFLLGMLLTLIVTGAAIAFLVMQLMQIKKAEQEEAKLMTTVYVLKNAIKSGDELKADIDLQTAQVSSKNAPTDYLTPSDLGEKNIAKINLTPGTVLSKEMIYTEEDTFGKDIRKQEYNMIVLPIDLTTGDYVDVRWALPSGQDYIVISKKKVEIPVVGGIDSTDTVWMNLTEDETLAMNNAIVEAYKKPGSKLYITKYVEPGMQEAATPTYPVNAEVLSLINGNPNIVEEARNALWARYNATDTSGNRTQVNQRNDVINQTIADEGETADSNVETKMEESITNTKTTRKTYLDSLGTTVE